MITKTLVTKFQKAYGSANSKLVERGDILKGAALAILARKHVFLLGPPGTAKSLAIEVWCKLIGGVEYFRFLLTRFTKPDELFGPLSITALKADRYERNMTGYLPRVHIAFLDEIWKASSSIINALLTLANERIFKNGTVEKKCPIISIFTASNELPENGELNAAYDRFLLRYYVGDIVDDNSFKTLLTMNGSTLTPILTLQDIEQAQAEVKQVKLDSILDFVVTLRNKLKASGFEYSPRRWRESMDVLQAHAWLDGRDEVEIDDFDILSNILWEKPDDRREITRLILSVNSPELQRALELLDIGQEIRDSAIKLNTTGAGMDANDKFKDTIIPELNAMPQTTKVKAIHSKIVSMQREVAITVLGMSLN